MTEEHDYLREESDSEWICEKERDTGLYSRIIIRHVLFPPIDQDQFKEDSDVFIPWHHDGITKNLHTDDLRYLVEIT